MDSERLKDVLIFTLGTLTELRIKGLVQVTDDAELLTASGMDEFIRLKASGFNPDADEVRAAVALFMMYGDDELATPASDASK